MWYLAIHECPHLEANGNQLIEHDCPLNFKVAKYATLEAAGHSYYHLLFSLRKEFVFNSASEQLMEYLGELDNAIHINSMENDIGDEYVYMWKVGPYTYMIADKEPSEVPSVYPDGLPGWEIVADHFKCTDNHCVNLEHQVDKFLEGLFND